MADRIVSEWGRDAAGVNMTDPGKAQETAGYANSQKPPNGEENYLYRQFTKCPVVVAHPADAAVDLVAGRCAVVLGELEKDWRAEDAWLRTISGSGAYRLKCDGRLLYGQRSGVLGFDPRTGVTDPTFGGGAAVGGSDALAVDGAALFAVDNGDDLIRKYDPKTGAAYAGWTNYAWGGNVEDLASDGQLCFAVGAVGDGDGDETVGLNWTTGAKVWGESAAGAGAAIVAAGRHVYAAIGNFVRRYLASDGSPEGSYDHGGQVNALCVTDRGIAIGGAAGTGTKHVRLLPWDLGSELWSYQFADGAGEECKALAWDGRAVWAGKSRGTGGTFVLIGIFDGPKFTVPLTWAEITADAHGVYGLTSDGHWLYVSLQTTGAVAERKVFALPVTHHGARLFRMTSGRERYRQPYHGILIPVESRTGQES